MAEGYTSWNCPDLNDVTLYSSDIIVNPDWPTCSLVRPYGYNIIDHFKADIDEAFDQGVDWSSGIIKLGRWSIGGTLLNYLQIEIRVIAATSYLNVTVGYGDGNTFTHSNSQNFGIITYRAWKEYEKCVYILRDLDRENPPLYANLPNYTGTKTYYVVFGACDIYTGSWEGPSSQYPNGHMVYTLTTYFGDMSTALLSIPCASDNEQSRSEQSEGVFRPLYYDSVHSSNPDFYVGDYEGHYDDNPENPRKKDPNEEDPGGESGEGGGDGDHRQPYVPIPIPGIPTIGPNSAGFVYMLRLTVAQMQQFALDLVRPTWWTALKNFFADPLDFICGIMIVPYEPVSNYSVYPKFGENVFEHAYPQVYQQYTEIDCGGLPVPKYFGSCFDNNPYTELLLWLPYIGYRKLDPDECVGKTIYVKYHCDCLTGDCVAFVMTRAGQGYEVPFDRVIAQFSGNCGVRVPFGSTSFDAAIAASVQLLGGAVGAVAGGALGAAVGVSGASIGASQIGNSIAGSTVSAVNGSKVTSERSGVSGACAGYLSIQYPYLLRTVPNQSLPKNYQDLEGYPSNIAGPLTKFSGFTAVESIDLNGLDATKEEINEIKQLLIGGVYI